MRGMLVHLVCLLSLSSLASGQDQRYEGEALASGASITAGGGSLLIVESITAEMPFSGGNALVFTPDGKNAELTLKLSVEKAGVYRLRLGVVLGPSQGNYAIVANGTARGEFNFYGKQTVHHTLSKQMTRGALTPRMLLKEGVNTITFRCTNWSDRAGSLVLDTLAVEPERGSRLDVYKPTPYEAQPPANEQLGPELVRSGDFETFEEADTFAKQFHVIKNWCFNSAVPREHPPVIVDPAIAHEGRVCMRLVPDPLEEMAVLLQAGLPLESGKRYRVSAWIKGPGLALIYLFQPPRTPAEDATGLQNHFRAGSQWQRVTFVVTPSVSGKVSTMNLALYGTEASDIHYDDVSVREILSSNAKASHP